MILFHEEMEGGEVAKLSYISSQGNKFEILEGSHVSLEGNEGQDFFWEWESATAVHAQLVEMLAQGEQILQRLRDLVSSRPFIAG